MSRIKALPQDVVDKIAAGEVVQRPASVIKELIENSLDAGSTSIVIHYDSNKLQVIDNGSGIRREDLNLAATRFATSKLLSVDDFDSLSSFGFRGEALASMSLVARLEIVSRTDSTPTAFSQSYLNGAPKGSPKPQARKKGTTVNVSDLFYNLPHRQKLTQQSEEYNKVLTVVQRYAIHYPHVGFVCQKMSKKTKKQVVDLNTGMLSSVKSVQSDPGNDDKHDKARRQIFAHVFGSNMESCLLKFNGKEVGLYEVDGLVSDPSIGETKATCFVLFCNHRWVESNELKRSIEGLYAQFTKTKPLIYISIHVPPNEVDVNVHPSKKQVALLHQEKIYASIIEVLRKMLDKIGRTFQKASVKVAENPYKRKRTTTKNDEEKNRTPKSTKSQSSQPTAQSKDKVRTSTSAPSGAIEPFLVSSKSPTGEENVFHEASCAMSKPIDLTDPGAFARRCNCTTVVRAPRIVSVAVPKIITTACTYKSIKSLRNRITKHANGEWRQKMRREAIFVGIVSDQRCLIQCGVELQIWHFERLAQLLFTQLVLLQFGGMGKATFEATIDVTLVVGQLLELEDMLDTPLPKKDIPNALVVRELHRNLADQVADCLLEHSEMLQEYFNVGFRREDGKHIVLESLPVILPGHSPNPSGLPLFLLRLATKVNWETEKTCFQGISRELGLYYGASCRDQLQHKMFPAICQLLTPPKDEIEDCCQKITQLSTLYRAFER